MKVTDFTDLIRQFIRDQWINFRRGYTEPEAREELLGGARIYFYTPGSYAAINVYADPECSIPLPNPVCFNSSGELPPVFKQGESSLDAKIVGLGGETILIATPADQFGT